MPRYCEKNDVTNKPEIRSVLHYYYYYYYYYYHLTASFPGQPG